MLYDDTQRAKVFLGAILRNWEELKKQALANREEEDIEIPHPFNEIGTGKYSVTISHPLFRNKVAKIVVKDPAYRIYTKVLSHIESPHKPVFYGDYYDGDLSVHIMERLHAEGSTNVRDFMGDLRYSHSASGLLSTSINYNFIDGKLNGTVIPQDNTFVMFIVNLGQELRRKTNMKFSLDLHNGNLMWRKLKENNYVPVITDPLAFGNKDLEFTG